MIRKHLISAILISCEDVISRITSCDIFTLQETWLLPGEKIKLTGYESFKSNRNPTKKGVDGVLILYKNTYIKGISRQTSSNEKYVIWIKLDKTFFGLENDIFVAAGYRPPREGAIGTFYKKLERDISKFSLKGDIILVGDLNSRIGALDQDINHIDIDKYDNLRTRSLDLSDVRTSEDEVVNKKGRELIDVCNKNQLIILNGRKLGDFEGKYTCHKYSGSSGLVIIVLWYLG